MNDHPNALAIWAARPDDNSGDFEFFPTLKRPDGGLGLPTAELMALGGDARITVDEASGLNSYGCAPKPIPAISYASSTASTVSSGAFAQARAFHFRLQEEARERPVAEIYGEAMEAARSRIRAHYGIESTVEIAFGPSGTDLEYLVLALALRAAEAVRNFVVEVDEVGSGCLNAQRGRWFAPRTALGLAADVGEAVPGFPCHRIEVETIPVREADGGLRDPEERERRIEERLGQALDSGERPLLHVVHRSKTGLVAPSLSALDRIVGRFGGAVDIVVDACQGRVSPAAIRAYLARGATVFVTGSKFIGGPPFSAFALIPAPLARRMESAAPAPRGLGAFFARGDMPGGWRAMDPVLPEIPNFGLLLRLECGLFELGRLLAYPGEVIGNAIAAFGRALRELPEFAPFELVESGAGTEEASHPLDRTMLYTLRLTDAHPETGAPLDIDDARAVYMALYTDISGRFSDPRDRLIASETVHVGQPVRCQLLPDGRWAGTLRLSLSAPHISQIAGLGPNALLARFRTDLAWISEKIRLSLDLLRDRKI